MLPTQAEIDVASEKLGLAISDLDNFEMDLRLILEPNPEELARFVAGDGPAPEQERCDLDQLAHLIVLATDARSDADTIKEKATAILRDALLLYHNAESTPDRYGESRAAVAGWHREALTHVGSSTAESSGTSDA